MINHSQNMYAAIRESLADRRDVYAVKMMEAETKEKFEYWASLRTEMKTKIWAMDRSYKS